MPSDDYPTLSGGIITGILSLVDGSLLAIRRARRLPLQISADGTRVTWGVRFNAS